jgi:hypothetical protein
MKKTLFLLLFVLTQLPTFAQSPTLGIPPFGSFSGGFETINNQNLNVYFNIPIASSPGRGMPLSLNLSNNSLIWQPAGSAWVPVTDASGNPT